MLRTIEAALGSVDVLVNNAGVILEKSFADLTEQDWDRVVDTDLKSVFLCCRAVLPGMTARGGGVVINVASELGFLGRERYVPYCAAKAGVIGLTKALARELAPRIRVNGIAPGPVNTPMLSLETMSAEWLQKELDIPARRVGEPDEIAATALFLASDHARFYYGQMLSPNGGAWMA
jgi:3-oxoacyl-[acyl-carrier protein] reductase